MNELYAEQKEEIAKPEAGAEDDESKNLLKK